MRDIPIDAGTENGAFGRRFDSRIEVPMIGRVLNTCLYQGFRADLADRAEAEIR
jgi:hypothetical protein